MYFIFLSKCPILDLSTVCFGCLGGHQLEGNADAVQGTTIPMEKGQTRLCMYSATILLSETIKYADKTQLYYYYWLSSWP